MKTIIMNPKINIMELEYLKFRKEDNEHLAVLIDHKGYEIVRGYGRTVVESLNDLHRLLI